MSSVTDCKRCKQCGYEYGIFDLDCQSNESEFCCRRCGYCESSVMITDDEGDCTGWRRDTHHGYGAYSCVEPGRPDTGFVCLHSARAVDEAAREIRERIAKGELDGERSYVTRWHDNGEYIEVIVGRWTKLDCEDNCMIIEKGTGEADS